MSDRSTIARGRPFFILVTALLLFIVHAEAQVSLTPEVASPLRADTLPVPPPNATRENVSGPLLERSVSRTGYVLGPADVLNLSIFDGHA
jgi:hypothetical protein